MRVDVCDEGSDATTTIVKDNVGTWTVNLRGTPTATEEPPPGRGGEPIPGDGTTEEMVTMNEPAEPEGARHAAMAHHDHEHDHENMAFTMFRRTESGGLVELQASDIERDTSDYDEEGHDHGVEPAPNPPPPPTHNH